jgi:crotonobetainyl-CoA:carnitine CoA-transferase CaiB-like acyl-CoA transferase
LAGALDGVRIVDATTMFAGPLATMMLGDQGADVIKVEPPGGQGDLMRSLGMARGGIAATFHAVNRNKRSIVLDLRDPRGAELLGRLVERADVFVQNHRPGVAERLGADEATLRRRRFDLVYVSMAAWGEDGPFAERPAFDSVMQSASGIAASQAGPDGRPDLVRNAVVDKVTGLHLAQAITAALYARERSGEGQHVRVNMLDAAVAFLWLDGMQHRMFVGSESDRRNPWMRLLRTRDGWLILSLNSNPSFRAAMGVLGADDVGADPRYQTAEGRGTSLDGLFDALERYTVEWTSDELCERLARADVPCSPVTALADVERHPQVLANGTLLESDHPVSGRIRHARPVATFDGTPATVRRLAPARSEHADEILAELGLSPADCEALRACGVDVAGA